MSKANNAPISRHELCLYRAIGLVNQDIVLAKAIFAIFKVCWRRDWDKIGAVVNRCVKRY